MQLGIHFMNFTLPGGSAGIAPILGKTVRTAEEVGCAWFTLMDHYFQMEHFATSEDPMLEGYTSLGFVAGQTERMRLGLLVTGVTYRHPGLLAKIVTTLDVLSGGRAMLGIGAAWYEREHLGLGVPYPPLKERFERLEETLRICRQMWSEDDGPFEGTHYRLAETLNHPAPIQQPGPPILIGGGGERKTLRLVAQYGDACNLFGTGADDVAHKLDVLKRHCDELDRDYAAITKTITGGGDPLRDPDGFVRAMEQYAGLGIDHVQLAPAGPDPEAYVARLGEGVIERVAALG
ncbi:LLM class F420-dependent oxidoreductase [Rathayibacter tritici]|uniref:LLM class F420-dependent oxidoreductase n=1 Tax=Rathayibacter tritici TaxID=33888 RepID=UPI000CE850A0|nr:LLM class F420-dependent oxidoreductase [Rathayibacter tritici]PPF69770.1 LLM class F420-dependent oxidoreductase [Rathayibacter tritici]PPG09200.1 LLM class F420-dependent oxidoreductase [Rathayibacter tritici]